MKGLTLTVVMSLIVAAALDPAAQAPLNPCPRPIGLKRPPETAEQRPLKGEVGLGSDHDPNSDVIRVDTKLVVTEFDVRNKKGRPVFGLNEADFRVEEDGVEQTVEIFSFGRASAAIARSVVLVIDYSQSQSPYIETSIEAAKVLVDLLEPHDRMAIVTDDVELLIGFTSDKSALKVKLDSLKGRSRDGSFGKSLQMTALHASVAELFDRGDKRPVVVLQTDGDEYAQLALWYGRPRRDDCAGMLRNYEQLEKTLEDAGTTVYSVIPGVVTQNPNENSEAGAGPRDLKQTVRYEAKLKLAAFDGPMKEFAVRNWTKGRLRDAGAVERLSQLTGGTSHFLDRPENAGKIYRSILDKMNNRYLIGYYPKKDDVDGRQRSIKVTLNNGSGMKVIGRTSYTPRK